MNEIVFILFAVLGGMGLGGAFFGSLYWSTKRLAHFQRPVATIISLFFFESP